MCIELVEHERRFFHLLDTLGQYTVLPVASILRRANFFEVLCFFTCIRPSTSRLQPNCAVSFSRALFVPYITSHRHFGATAIILFAEPVSLCVIYLIEVMGLNIHYIPQVMGLDVNHILQVVSNSLHVSIFVGFT